MKLTVKSHQLRLAMIAAVAAGGIGFAGNGVADDTENLTVSATVTATCTITTAPVAFGVYDPTAGSALNGTGTVTALCTNGTDGYITLGQGLNADTGSTDAVPLRRMAGGAAGAGRLSYFLYSEGTRTDVWGNTGTTGLNHEGDGTATGITVYGTIPAGQNVIAGSGGTAYADTVVATITL